MVPNEDEWSKIFDETFADLPDLPEFSYASFDARTPLKYNSKGEAIFICGTCSRKWTSINGMICFEYWLRVKDAEGVGEVTLHALGQKCKRCSGNPFIPAKFTEEAIDNSLSKLLAKVKEKFYEAPDLDKQMEALELNRNMTGRGTHDSSLCEGCALGICRHEVRDYTVARSGRYSGSSNYNCGDLSSPKIKWVLLFGKKEMVRF